MIVFEKVRWKNLLATGNEFIEIELNSHKKTLFVGPNGQGKSTVLDALCFALFGRPYRKINKPQLVNSINEKALLTEVELKIGSNQYLIRRGIKPNIFEIFCNEVLVNQDSASRDYQAFLEQNILKIDYRSFLQIVILGTANFTPFMQLAAQQRREIIEDLLDIKIFSTMNTVLKDQIRDNKNTLTQCENQLEVVRTKLDLTLRHMAAMQEMREADRLLKVDKLERNRKTVGELETALKEHQKLLSEYETNRNRLTKINKTMEAHKKHKAACETQASRYADQIKVLCENPLCPTCKEPLSKEKVDAQLIELTQKMLEQNEAAAKFETEIAKFEGLDKLIETTDRQISGQMAQIANCTGFLKSHRAEIATLTNELAKVETKDSQSEEDRIELEKAIVQLDKQKAQLLIDQEVLGICAVLLKDGGIKAKVIAQYIPVINKLINKFLTAMDFFVQFSLDTSFNETILSRYRDNFSYASFSEGEKNRIDLALLFTWRALAKLRNSMSTNLLIFDEVLDGSLDHSGMDDLLQIIEQLTGDTNVVVISHREGSFEKFDRVVRFQKVRNFTEIAE